MNDINKRFSNFRAGCDAAPDRMFEAEKTLRDLIGEAVDHISIEARKLGLKPCNSDGAHNVEATIYAWLTKGSDIGASVEGLGMAQNYPRAAEIKANLERDRDFLEARDFHREQGMI